MDSLDYRRAFEATPGRHVLLSSELVITAVTEAFLETTRRTREAIVGRSFFDAFPPASDSTALRTGFGRASSGHLARLVALPYWPTDETAGGEVRFLSAPVCDATGAVVAVVHTIEDSSPDVAERRRLEAAAEAASAAKNEFLSSMSHELRTPLNAILGFAQLLKRDKKSPLSDQNRARVDQILKGGEHLLGLINEILDLSHIEASEISLVHEEVDVGAVARDVMRTLDPLASLQGISLEAENLDATRLVDADPTRFAQVLLNFGSNAIKYNRPSGRVVFAISAPTQETIRVLVKDSGIGVPLGMQERLFQPFQRAGQEAGPIPGTGIGLVIAKRLTERMGGKVGFRSVPGEGSEFWVDMPAVVSRAA